MTSYQREFTQRPIERQQQPEVVVETVRPFEGESSYKRDFTEKTVTQEAPAAIPIKPPQVFYGETSYNKQFGEKPLPRKPTRAKSGNARLREL